MMKKTIYIHIGTEKTGTKSIQTFSCNHNEFLKQNNLYYPFNKEKKYMFNITHWPLAAALTKNNKFVPEDKMLPAKEMYDLLKEDIEKVPYDNILISGEPFSVNVTEKKSIQTLKNQLSDYNVKIIVYLRRQDNYYVSLTSTKIKGGVYNSKGKFTIDEVLSNRDRYDYEYFLNKWADVFGKENIIVKPYERNSFKNQSIIDDFFDIFGIDVTDLSKSSSDANVSLSLDSLYLLNIINGKFNLDTKERTKIFSLLEKRKSNYKIKDLISPRERREIIDFYQSSNEYVAKEFLQREDGILFNEPVPEETHEWEEFKGLTPEMALDLCKYLLSADGQDPDSRVVNTLIEGTVKKVLHMKKAKGIPKLDGSLRSLPFNLKDEMLEEGNMISWFKKEDAGWHLMSTGVDPYFLLANFKGDTKEMTLDLNLTAPEDTKFQVFYKSVDTEFSPNQVVTKLVKKGQNELRLHIQSDKPISDLRIDPGTTEGEYIIQHFEIRGDKN